MVVVDPKKIFFRKIFFWFSKLDAICRPVAGKPFVLEELSLGMGTSVASALTAETMFEIMKCISDVDMRGRVRMGSKAEIFKFFNSGYAHDRNISIFRRRAFLRTQNTPKYASVRHSRNSLHRDTQCHAHRDKKSRGGAVL